MYRIKNSKKLQKPVVSWQQLFCSVSLIGDKPKRWKETLHIIRTLISTISWQCFGNAFKQSSPKYGCQCLAKAKQELIDNFLFEY